MGIYLTETRKEIGRINYFSRIIIFLYPEKGLKGIAVNQACEWTERNWIFATNSDFLITISLKPNVVDLRYFKLWIFLNQIIRVWNIKGLQQRVLKILGFKYLILLQKLNSFANLSLVPLKRSIVRTFRIGNRCIGLSLTDLGTGQANGEKMVCGGALLIDWLIISRLQ